MKKNKAIHYISAVMSCCINIMITGAVIQTFLLNSACTEEQVSTYVSVLQIVQMATMLLLSGRMEQLKNIFHSTAWSVGMQILLFITMIWMSISYEAPVERKYIIFFGVSILVSFFQGVNNVISYKLPYYVLDMREYGSVVGIGGVISGIAGVAYAGALSYFAGRYPYFKVMTFFSGVGIIFTIIIVLCVESYQPIFRGMQEKKGDKVNLFHYKPFYRLLVPNILRGISSGIFGLIALIGYSCDVLDSSGTSWLVTLSQIGGIVGCLLYSLIAGRIKEGTLLFGSCLGFCVMLPMMLLLKSQTVFLMIYLIVYLFFTCVNNAIPVFVARNIEYRCIGQYTAWRMAIHTLGTAMGSAIVPLLLKTLGGINSLVVCGLLMMICGLCYWRFKKQKNY